MQDNYHLYLTPEERRTVINSLLDLRNDFILRGKYTDVIDELLIKFMPNLTLPEQDKRPIGLWGQQHLRYIKRSRPILYTNLLTKCKLNEYLADINVQAQKMYDKLVQTFVKEEGCTEQLKANDQMLWVRKMNNAAQRAREVVNAEIIYKLTRRLMFSFSG